MTRFARELLRIFPRARTVFAYGSAAFRQPGLYDAPLQHAPMLDIIFAADSPAAWHHEVGVSPNCCRMVRSSRTLAHGPVVPMYRFWKVLSASSSVPIPGCQLILSAEREDEWRALLSYQRSPSIIGESTCIGKVQVIFVTSRQCASRLGLSADWRRSVFEQGYFDLPCRCAHSVRVSGGASTSIHMHHLAGRYIH